MKGRRVKVVTRSPGHLPRVNGTRSPWSRQLKTQAKRRRLATRRGRITFQLNSFNRIFKPLVEIFVVDVCCPWRFCTFSFVRCWWCGCGCRCCWLHSCCWRWSRCRRRWCCRTFTQLLMLVSAAAKREVVNMLITGFAGARAQTTRVTWFFFSADFNHAKCNPIICEANNSRIRPTLQSFFSSNQKNFINKLFSILNLTRIRGAKVPKKKLFFSIFGFQKTSKLRPDLEYPWEVLFLIFEK